MKNFIRRVFPKAFITDLGSAVAEELKPFIKDVTSTAIRQCTQTRAENSDSVATSADEAKAKLLWDENIHLEYEEWDEEIKTWPRSETAMGYATYQHSNIMPDSIVELLPREKDEYDILDVGSGPRCWFGSTIPNKTVNLTCCDPLAEFYKESYRKYDIPQVYDLIKAEAEKLLETFRYNQFDLVTARNCLDHSYSPEQSILQMATCSKRHILLLHCLNEGKTAWYNGLHQWDFDVEDGDFVIKGNVGKINFTKKYAHLFKHETRFFDSHWRGQTQHWFELILEKK